MSSNEERSTGQNDVYQRNVDFPALEGPAVTMVELNPWAVKVACDCRKSESSEVVIGAAAQWVCLR